MIGGPIIGFSLLKPLLQYATLNSPTCLLAIEISHFMTQLLLTFAHKFYIF